MFEKGVSVYVGLDHTPEANRDFLRLARRYGYNRIFTSLHIPEADSSAIARQFRGLLAEASELGFQITADISPRTFNLLGLNTVDLTGFRELGITALRLDFGFGPDEITRFTRASGLEIEINASTLTAKLLHAIRKAGADLSRLRACHNYYPRPETGLSFALFAERSAMLRDYSIPVTAFIPSLRNPRGPIYAGLPTLESHRGLGPVQAAKELMACRLVDGIIFGDSLAAEEELAAVAALDPFCLELQVTVSPDLSAAERAILFAHRHTNRTDPGAYAIRSQESRTLCDTVITPRNLQCRERGSVTIDNESYRRYMGELQVIVTPLPGDEKTNVVAQIIPEELFLLNYIGPGDSFRFKEATK